MERYGPMAVFSLVSQMVVFSMVRIVFGGFSTYNQIVNVERIRGSLLRPVGRERSKKPQTSRFFLDPSPSYTLENSRLFEPKAMEVNVFR